MIFGMPSVNIYTSKERVSSLEKILPGLREAVARELSCADRTLANDEISVRVLVPDAALQIADTELEIKAHSYGDRVKRQDDICKGVKSYVQKECLRAGSVYVWLQLTELGHSA